MQRVIMTGIETTKEMGKHLCVPGTVPGTLHVLTHLNGPGTKPRRRY